MRHCPKCGSCRIVGPTYRDDIVGERLIYACVQCGYTMSTRTSERDQARAAVQLLETELVAAREEVATLRAAAEATLVKIDRHFPGWRGSTFTELDKALLRCDGAALRASREGK